MTQVLAAWISDAGREPMPEDVAKRVHIHFIDTVAAMIVGAGQPWSRRALAYAEQESRDGAATAIGATRTLSGECAAFANATAAHGFEIDDFALPGLSHPGCVVVPATIALAEEGNLSARATMEALTIGFETIVRLGAACAPSLTSHRGFHVTSVFGVFGAAAVGAVARGLSGAETASALGLAVAHAGGTTEFTRSGGDSKRLHAGFAASGGLRAAALAELGATGPEAAIEGERGFLRAYVEQPNATALTDGLGSTWAVRQLAAKRWSVCGGLQAPLAALDRALANARGAVAAEDITAVEVGMDAASLSHVSHVGPDPADMTAAQMSVHHAIALRIVAGGNDPRHYANYDRERVLAAGSNVSTYVDAAAERDFPHHLHAEVTVRLIDGQVHTVRAEAPGTGEQRLDFDGVTTKFRALCEPILGPRTDHVVAAAMQMPDVGVQPLMTELRRAKTR